MLEEPRGKALCVFLSADLELNSKRLLRIVKHLTGEFNVLGTALASDKNLANAAKELGRNLIDETQAALRNIAGETAEAESPKLYDDAKS